MTANFVVKKTSNAMEGKGLYSGKSDYESRKAFRQFLEGKSPIAQSCLGFSFQQIESIAVVGGNPHIKPIPLYTLNPTSLARASGKYRTALLEFLGGKSTQAQSCQGFSLLEISEISAKGRGNRIKPIPLYRLNPTSRL